MTMENDRSTVEVPVLIVGAGPAGLTLSLSLSRYGVPHMIIDKHPGTAHTPRAHIINQRTMEIYRDLGIEDRVRAVATPSEMMTNNVWATSLAGLELARLQTWGTSADRAADYRKASPSGMCNCPQHILEPVLVEAITDAAVADLRFRHEFCSLDQDDDGVTATLLDRSTGQELVVRSKYLVGADGGRSRVVEQLGLPMEGQGALASAANVWFSADLTEYCAQRPGTLYWNASPGRDYFIGAGTFICVRPWDDWVMLFMYDPQTEQVDPEDHDALRARVHKVIGDDSVKVDIHSTSFWEINDLVASHYAQGRVFCMGDAVHRHPPSNGLGLNTSTADGYNLAWKLRLVLEGKAAPGLLDSYNAERQPVGRQTVDRALQSISDMAPIPAALGFHPEQSDEEGWANVAVLFEASDAGRARRKAVAEAIELTNYQFNAHGVELGYRYRDGAVVHADDPEPAPDRDPELYYHATTWPGARVPHAWLGRGLDRVSTLDVVGNGRFVLLTGIGGEGWVDAAKTAAEQTGVDVDVVFIGARDGLRDSYGEWARVREVDETGCVLVRPDAHVAWRSQSSDPDSLAELSTVLARILGLALGHPVSR
ncbi:MAG: tfdB [Streptosporangiaceae bacterium]|nr:tfdB [Streptosporangiaceae bacterium]